MVESKKSPLNKKKSLSWQITLWRCISYIFQKANVRFAFQVIFWIFAGVFFFLGSSHLKSPASGIPTVTRHCTASRFATCGSYTNPNNAWLVGGFSPPNWKNMLIKMGWSSPIFGVKIKIYSKPPTRLDDHGQITSICNIVLGLFDSPSMETL